MEYDYNEYNKKKYDRVSLMLPKGLKKYVQSYAEKHGITIEGLEKPVNDIGEKEEAPEEDY